MSANNNSDTAYCTKCKAKREIKDVVERTLKNGRVAKQGVCTQCGTKAFKIMGLATKVA